MLVLDQLKNTYICSSDNYFSINPFNKYEYKATYSVQKHDISEESEYYVTTNKQGLITDVVIGEGEMCMVGHVFYDDKFSETFKNLLISEYEKEETRYKLWEKVYVENMEQFKMYAKEYLPTEILEFDFNVWEKTNEFIEKIAVKGRDDFKDFEELFEKMTKVYELTESDGYSKILCHCDFYDPNILFKGDEMYLIDWEYAGNDDPGVDLGTYIACSDYTFEEATEVLDMYEGETMSDERRKHFIGYVSLASYYWFVWVIFQESNGAAVGEYLYIWYRNSYKYADIALEMYGA